MAERRSLILLDGRTRELSDSDTLKNALSPSVYDPQGIVDDAFSLDKMTGLLSITKLSDAGSSIGINAGTGNNEVLQLDSLGRIPIIDGSNVYNLQPGSLVNLTDISITEVGDNDILAFDLTSGKYKNKNPSEIGIALTSHNHNLEYEALSDKGSVNGYCPLDASSKVPTINLPDFIVGAVSYKGVWNADTNTPTLLNGSGAQGEYRKVSVAGSTLIDGISDWKVGDWIINNGIIWEKLDNTDLTGYEIKALYEAELNTNAFTDSDKSKLNSILTMVGDTGTGGSEGLVPAPSEGDGYKFLMGSGNWGIPSRATRFFFSNTI